MTETELHGDAEMYTRPVLAIYDPIALGMVCPLAWRCPRRYMLAFYDRNIRGTHLDVGPGSGYFLDKCRFPVAKPSITLVDLNELVLTTVTRRIARYRPVSFVRDVLHPLDLGDRRFESAAVMNVLHCLPGTMAQKVTALENVLPYVEPGGRIFGSTVLGKDVDLSRFGHWMMRQYNAAGSFRNADDTLEALDAELSRRFAKHRLRVKGAMAFFEIDV